ncbi:MAG: helix-turn-helix transcriptional regulator [Alphaproteobacteria bacterium]|nr:helix-turn-helix transcriptional regulator [Alphaproteobacteria bacterium]
MKKGERTMNHYQIWHAIDLFAHEHGLSCSGLAKCSGLDPTTFNKSKRFSKYEQPRWPSTETISKILTATDSSPQDFFKFITATCDNEKDK